MNMLDTVNKINFKTTVNYRINIPDSDHLILVYFGIGYRKTDQQIYAYDILH